MTAATQKPQPRACCLEELPSPGVCSSNVAAPNRHRSQNKMFGLESTACPRQDHNGSEQKALPSVPCIGSASSLLFSLGDNAVCAFRAAWRHRSPVLRQVRVQPLGGSCCCLCPGSRAASRPSLWRKLCIAGVLLLSPKCLLLLLPGWEPHPPRRCLSQSCPSL